MAERWSEEVEAWPRTLGDGRYRGLQKIGAGSAAFVLSALDTTTGNRVALKLARSAGSGPAYDIRRFQADYDRLKRIRHPHLVPVMDYGTFDGRPWFTMPIHPRGTLHQLLHRRGRIDPVEALMYTFRVLIALSVLHDRGTVHRDVKPSNVLLDHEGATVLSDVGMCRNARRVPVLRGGGGGRRDARGFRAPEQTADGRADSAASDLYGAGATLYRLITGVRSAMLFSESRRRTLLLPVPRSVRPVIMRATSLDPSARYQDAADMARDVLDARDLLRLRDGHPPVADQWMASFYVPVQEIESATPTTRMRNWLRTVLAV